MAGTAYTAYWKTPYMVFFGPCSSKASLLFIKVLFSIGDSQLYQLPFRPLHVMNQAPKDPAGGSDKRSYDPSRGYHWLGNPGVWRSRDWIMIDHGS